MADWTDMPIVLDTVMPCPHCNEPVIQHRVIYKEAEYRTCTRCGFKQTIDQNFAVSDTSTADPTKDYYDFKRNNPRKYRPRNKPAY